MRFKLPFVISISPFIFLCSPTHADTAKPARATTPPAITANPAEVVYECELDDLGISKNHKVKQVTGAVIGAELHSGCLNYATDSDFGHPVINQKPNGSIVLVGPDGREVTLLFSVKQHPVDVIAHDESGTDKHPQAKVTGLSQGNLVTSDTKEIRFSLVKPHESYDDPRASTALIQCLGTIEKYQNTNFKYLIKDNAFVLPSTDTARLFAEMPLGTCNLSANFVSKDGELAESFETVIQKAIMTIEGRVLGPDGKVTTELAGRLLNVRVPGAYDPTGANVVIKINSDGTFKVGPLPTSPNNPYMITLVDLKQPSGVSATVAPIWSKKTPYVVKVDLGVRGGTSRSYSAESTSSSKSPCSACDHVEKFGDEGLEELKKMPRAELAKKDDQGATPFFWSIFHGQNKTRDFLLATLTKEELISDEQATKLYSRCANESNCSAGNLELLHKLEFKIGDDALSASVAGTQECSLEKFELLKKFGARLDAKDENGSNILHQIVDRSRQGRPKFSRDCLVSAMKTVIKDRSELMKQKNKDNRTPLQLAQHFKRTKGERGSAVTSKDIEPIVKALQ